MYSFAAGRQAKALHDGAFVWADSTAADISSEAANSFIVRASGGITLYTDGAATTGALLASGSGSWSTLSDRDLKENFAPVDGQQVLSQLARVPITTWNYEAQDPAVRHMGPMAQDLYGAFGLGEDERHISSVDADGVALAAIQGLYERSLEQVARIEALEGENASLRERLDDVDARLAALEEPRSAQAGTPLTGGAANTASLTWLGWVLVVVVAGVFVRLGRAGGAV
jgi:hypothetical protein